MSNRFTTLINIARRDILHEDVDVDAVEDTALPDEDEIPDEELGDMARGVEDIVDDEPLSDEGFADREVDILNVALQMYRSNDQHSIESKNELSRLFEDGEYEELFSRLIGIADELI